MLVIILPYKRNPILLLNLVTLYCKCINFVCLYNCFNSICSNTNYEKQLSNFKISCVKCFVSLVVISRATKEPVEDSFYFNVMFTGTAVNYL